MREPLEWATHQRTQAEDISSGDILPPAKILATPPVAVNTGIKITPNNRNNEMSLTLYKGTLVWVILLMSHEQNNGPAVFITATPHATGHEDPSDTALASIVPRAIPGAALTPNIIPADKAIAAAGHMGMGRIP
jgi:hypothetical protein